MATLREWKPKEQHERSKQVLAAVLKDVVDKPQRDVLAAEFVEMADRALDLYLTNRTERGFFRGLNWVLPGLSALASAVGGSILAAGTLTGLLRWIVGGASLVGGIAGGLASVLKPSDELVVHQRWVRGYEDLWRDTWQYALTELPEADLVAARTKMRELAHQFTDIAEGAAAAPVQTSKPVR